MPVPGLESCMTALFLGLCIPAISSVIPILNALAKTLGDSLNVDR
jgi:hypothetical protein